MIGDVRFCQRDEVEPLFQVGDSPGFLVLMVCGAVTVLGAFAVAHFVGAVFAALLWVLCGGIVTTLATWQARSLPTLWPRALMDDDALYFAGGTMSRVFVRVPWVRVLDAHMDTLGLDIRGISVVVDVEELNVDEVKVFEELPHITREHASQLCVGVVTGLKKRQEVVAVINEYRVRA